jgi:hypothetical protein
MSRYERKQLFDTIGLWLLALLFAPVLLMGLFPSDAAALFGTPTPTPAPCESK